MNRISGDLGKNENEHRKNLHGGSSPNKRTGFGSLYESKDSANHPFNPKRRSLRRSANESREHRLRVNLCASYRM